MSDALLAHFVDGSDVDIKYMFDERRIELSAYDEKTQTRYALRFDRCTEVQVNYEDGDYEEGSDLNNLTEGIVELPSSAPGLRRFQIGFADNSMLNIQCRLFAMSRIEGKGWSWK